MERELSAKLKAYREYVVYVDGREVALAFTLEDPTMGLPVMHAGLARARMA